MEPQILRTTDTSLHLVQLPEGLLAGLSTRVEGEQCLVERVESSDSGQTWGDAETLLRISEEPDKWGLPEALADSDGGIHLFFLKHRDGDPYDHRAGEADKAKAKELSLQTCIDIWHSRSEPGSWQFPPPRCVWRGYTGALNSVVQMRNGRILLPFSFRVDKHWRKRGREHEDFTYWGYFRSTLLYSDDHGENWQLSPAELRVPVPDISYAYGACEPVVVERGDGIVWMLIRAQMGRFYECFSEDGLQWSTPRPTFLISSESPAGLSRLSDGRTVLLWNACLRFPYAYGGRHVLHGAVSEDEGRTWRGFREVYRDPLNSEPPPTSGDHGTAYPFPIATSDGKVIFFSGQGKGRRALAQLDPDWLCETEQFDDFASGLDEWSVFGTLGLGLVPHPEHQDRQVLKIGSSGGEMPEAAVRNFPLFPRGTLSLRMQLRRGATGATLLLTDHFSVPFDFEDGLHSVFAVEIGSDGRIGGAAALPDGQWCSLQLSWDCAEHCCQVLADGREVCELPQLRETLGPCYLRLRAPDFSRNDEAGFLVESVHVQEE